MEERLMHRARLLLADDHRIILDGLEQLFRREGDFEIVATCTDGEEALEQIRKLSPDVTVLDIEMPKRNGMSVLREVRDSNLPTRVVLLTASLNDAGVLEAMELGVWGVVLKESASVSLVDAVRRVVRGDRSLDPSLVNRAVEQMSRKSEALKEVQQLLSPREAEVTKMVATGLRNKEIALRLNITEGTVKFYLHSIYEKLGIQGRVELTLYAQSKGLV